MAPQGHEEGALEGHHDGAVRLEALRLHGDDSLLRAGAGLPLRQHTALRVQGVPHEHGGRQPDAIPPEVRHALGTGAVQTHPPDDGEGDEAGDEWLLPLRLAGVDGVDVERVGVEAQQGLPHVVHVGDGAPGTVLEDVPHLEVLVEEAVGLTVALLAHLLVGGHQFLHESPLLEPARSWTGDRASSSWTLASTRRATVTSGGPIMLPPTTWMPPFPSPACASTRRAWATICAVGLSAAWTTPTWSGWMTIFPV